MKNNRETNKVKRFIASHDYQARYYSDRVCVVIPVLLPCGDWSEEYHTIRTMKQARIALGY